MAEAIRVWGELGRYQRMVKLRRTAQLVVERVRDRSPKSSAISRLHHVRSGEQATQ